MAPTALAPAPSPTVLVRRLQALAAATPITIAHRGDPVAHPENTLPAFEAAIAQGVAMVEFDVQGTRDGELVVLHDDTLDRTTDAARVLGRDGVTVAEVDLAALRRLDAGGWHSAAHAGTAVPTLREVLDCLAGRSIPMIEMKSGDPTHLQALLRELDLIDEVLVQSFDWDWLVRIHELQPALTIGALGEGPWSAAPHERLPATGAALVHWHLPDLRREDVGALHDAGYLVAAYTANHDVELLGAAALGLDGIVTNHPRRLRGLAAAGALLRPRR